MRILSRRPITLFALLAQILVVLACTSPGKPPANSAVKPTNIPIKVTAPDLLKSYEENVVAADYRFTGKIVVITGTVVGIDRFPDSIHVHLSAASTPYSLDYITCVFAIEQFRDVLNLKKGTGTTLSGTCEGRLWGQTVVLKDCFTNTFHQEGSQPQSDGLPTLRNTQTDSAVTVPNGASAICNDGTHSYSQSRRGTCSHHGGVAKWL
jgi:hypothetical protein